MARLIDARRSEGGAEGAVRRTHGQQLEGDGRAEARECLDARKRPERHFDARFGKPPKFFCARYAASRAMVLMRCASAVIAAISPVSLRSTSMRSSYPTPESVASIASYMAEAALAQSAASATERMTPAAPKKRTRKRRSGTSRTSAKKMRRLHLVRGVT